MLLSQIKILQAVTLGLWLEHILWDDLSNRKRTKKLEIKMSGNLNSSGSLKTDARGSSKYRLDSWRAQQIRWNKGSTEQAKDYTFFLGKRKWKQSIRDRIFVGHKSQQSEDRVCWWWDAITVLRGYCCCIIILNWLYINYKLLCTDYYLFIKY
jgi:hypothetical protein